MPLDVDFTLNILDILAIIIAIIAIIVSVVVAKNISGIHGHIENISTSINNRPPSTSPATQAANLANLCQALKNVCML